jgi:phosphatidylglycerol---prolipoprotein diacylglyceryl transferase
MTAFSIGSVHIYRYWLFYFITCLIGYWFLWWVWEKKWFENRPGVQKLLTKGIDDLILWTIIGVLVGWRLWHVFIYEWPYYSQHISEILMVWRWWMSFIWGIIGVICAIFYVERIYKLSRKEFFIIFDLLLLVIPIGIVLWRIWNFLNQELYWIAVPEALQWLWYFKITHIYPKIDTVLRFNTNFISAFFEWLVTWIIWVVLLFKQLGKWKWHPGEISISFIIVYSVIRFMLEFLRQDSQFERIGIFTTTQRFMVVFLMFGFSLWYFYKKE